MEGDDIILAGSDYKPHPLFLKVHLSDAQIRHVVCGIKSGKSKFGGADLVDRARKSKGRRFWACGPTYKHTQVCEEEIAHYLYQYPGLVKNFNKTEKRWDLYNDCIIELRSAHNPENLRGPNVDYVWKDESAFIIEESSQIIRGRTAARSGEILETTTPNGRGYHWDDCVRSGLPADQDYGIFTTKDQNRLVMHYPTWEFGWVPQSFLDEEKLILPKEMFDQEYGAMFLDSQSQVFRYIDEALLRDPFVKPEGQETKFMTVLGYDPGKHQDFAGVCVMDGSGRVIYIDRWNGMDYTFQRAKIEVITAEYNSAIVIDRSNVGTVLVEEFQKTGLQIHPVDMNSPDVKTQLIQSLQLAFENRAVRIPDYRTDWCPPAAHELFKELKQYEASVTKGRRLSYSAPKGKFDDLVISMALANWGIKRGLAGGGIDASTVMIARYEWDKIAAAHQDEKNNGQGYKPRLKRLRRPSDHIYRNRRRGSMDWKGSGRMWE